MKYYRTRHYEEISCRYTVMRGYRILELDSRIPDNIAVEMTLKQRVLNSTEVVKYPTFLYIPPLWDLRKFVELHQKYDADWQVLIDLGICQHTQFFPGGLEITANQIERFISEHPRFIDALRFVISSNDPARIRRLAVFARKNITAGVERCVWKNDSTLRLKNHLRFILSVAEGVVQ